LGCCFSFRFSVSFHVYGHLVNQLRLFDGWSGERAALRAVLDYKIIKHVTLNETLWRLEQEENKTGSLPLTCSQLSGRCSKFTSYELRAHISFLSLPCVCMFIVLLLLLLFEAFKLLSCHFPAGVENPFGLTTAPGIR